MQRDPRAFLWDVRESALAIQSFTAGMDAAAYASNPMAQAALERKFEVIGEALNQLVKLDATLAAVFQIYRRSWRSAINSSMATPLSTSERFGISPKTRCPP